MLWLLLVKDAKCDIKRLQDQLVGLLFNQSLELLVINLLRDGEDVGRSFFSVLSFARWEWH